LRHGGRERWDSLDAVVLRVAKLGGLLPLVKGIGATFPQPDLIRVQPKKLRVEFMDYPERARKTVFDKGCVAILASGQEEFPGALPDHRSTFDGLRKYRRWGARDAAYFFGYALCTYLSVPFLLELLPKTVNPWGAGGCRIRADFPPRFPTHGRRQEFFFDREGLLVRHDYRADIVGRWAGGAHFSSAYEDLSGIPVATRRRVFARLGGFVTPVPVLDAVLEPIEAVWNREAR
jgi:hypothetical protein